MAEIGSKSRHWQRPPLHQVFDMTAYKIIFFKQIKKSMKKIHRTRPQDHILIVENRLAIVECAHADVLSVCS